MNCSKCKKSKPDEEFRSEFTGKMRKRCHKCSATARKISRTQLINHPARIRDRNKNYLKRTPAQALLNRARTRAGMRGIPMTITQADIIIPRLCPILGIPLKAGDKVCNDGSPSLDAIDPQKGYIPGNIQVISHKANTMKSDATREQLLKFSTWIREVYV